MKQDTARPIATSLSKPEAIWRAIEELGYRADVTEILEYVRKKYGLSADPAQTPQAPPVVPASPPPASAAQPAATKPADGPPAEAARKPGGQKKPRAE